MYKVTKTHRIDAAHKILGHPGKCKNLHGHSYTFEITCVGEKLNEIGILLDFFSLKEIFNKYVEPLDHQFLNDHFSFSTTAENLAKWLYKAVHEELVQTGMFNGNINSIRVWKVRVWETPTSVAEYTEGL